MKKKVTLKDKLNAINTAVELGFMMPTENAYNAALEFLYYKVEPLEIEAYSLIFNRSSQYMDTILPSGKNWWVDGELSVDFEKKQVVELAQDVDGKMYKVVGRF